jgi:hypothetical protein
MRNRIVPTIAAVAGLALLFNLLPSAADAAAWTRRQGEFLFVIPVEYFFADEQFDGDGDRVDRDKFEQVELAPYLEFGLTDYLTVGAQPKYRWVELDTPGGSIDNEGLAETDVFTRVRLWHDGQAAFSIQGLVKVPIEADEGDDLPIGREQVDVELSALFGNGHSLDGGRIFYNLELGFRKRFDDPADEVHGDAFLGWTGGAWTVILHALNTIGLNSNADDAEVLTAEPEYRRHKAQLTLAYQVTDTTSLVAGASTTYAGRNVGVGHSGFLSAVFRF